MGTRRPFLSALLVVGLLVFGGGRAHAQYHPCYTGAGYGEPYC